LQDRFRGDILANRNNRALLARWDDLALPDGWLVAGCLFQTVWNLQAGRPPESGIKDYDLFYFDGAELGADAERATQSRCQALVADLGITVEVVNQARVHLWYEADFGRPYAALGSSRDGIARFLVSGTCVGVRPDATCAPRGLDALYRGELAMNPLVPHRDLFEAKAASYRARWPALRIVDSAA
jgi:hypothetical protein